MNKLFFIGVVLLSFAASCAAPYESVWLVTLDGKSRYSVVRNVVGENGNDDGTRTLTYTQDGVDGEREVTIGTNNATKDGKEVMVRPSNALKSARIPLEASRRIARVSMGSASTVTNVTVDVSRKLKPRKPSPRYGKNGMTREEFKAKREAFRKSRLEKIEEKMRKGAK